MIRQQPSRGRMTVNPWPRGGTCVPSPPIKSAPAPPQAWRAFHGHRSPHPSARPHPVPGPQRGAARLGPAGGAGHGRNPGGRGKAPRWAVFTWCAVKAIDQTMWLVASGAALAQLIGRRCRRCVRRPMASSVCGVVQLAWHSRTVATTYADVAHLSFRLHTNTLT
jgi:hypothetical protein